AVKLLKELQLPAGQSYTFTYDVPSASSTCPQRKTSATMTSATLPPGAKIKWDYQEYAFSGAPEAIGVKTRVIEVTRNGVPAEIQRTEYVPALAGSTTVKSMVRVGAEWRTRSRIVQYHR